MFALRTLPVLAALVFTAAHAAPPIEGLAEAPLLSVAGQTAYVLQQTPDGEPGPAPQVAGDTAVVLLGSRIGRVPSANLTAAISNGFFKVVGTVDLMVVGDPVETDLISRAAAKLHADEAAALVAGPFAMAEASLDHRDGRYDALLREALAHARELMAELNRPARFIAADGTEFDCYGDYVRYQWGGVGLPCW